MGHNIPYLKKGDTVGVITPSRYVFDHKEKIENAINTLKEAGFTIKIGSCFDGRKFFSSGDRKDRAIEINEMFADKEVKAIFCSIGGDTCNQLLDILDYDLIRRNPKFFIGYSDITNLILAIYQKTGITTFHGPNLNLIPDLNANSISQLLWLLSGEPRDINYLPKFHVIKHGYAEGRLLGGNLFVVNGLIKTEYLPTLEGSILFWEEIDEGQSAVEYQIYQLNINGILSSISGMVIGHIHKPGHESTPILEETLLKLTHKYHYPILKTDSFGHGVKEFTTFPIGAMATIDTKKKIFSWEQ